MPKKVYTSKKLPDMFRPLLWSLRWDEVTVTEDKEDIIVNTINEGALKQWRWIIKTYGKDTICQTLKKRLASEFHPESLRLAKIVFSLPHLRHARRSTKIKCGPTVSTA